MTTRSPVGRLAIREIHDEVRAFYALPHTMKGALLLGSIKSCALRGNKARLDEFLALMRGIVSDILEERTGERPSWGAPEAAPDHERGQQPWIGDA